MIFRSNAGSNCLECFHELSSFHCAEFLPDAFIDRATGPNRAGGYSIRHRNGNSTTGSDAKQFGQKDVLPLKIALGTHVRSFLDPFDAVIYSNTIVKSLQLQAPLTSLLYDKFKFPLDNWWFYVSFDTWKWIFWNIIWYSFTVAIIILQWNISMGKFGASQLRSVRKISMFSVIIEAFLCSETVVNWSMHSFLEKLIGLDRYIFLIPPGTRDGWTSSLDKFVICNVRLICISRTRRIVV